MLPNDELLDVSPVAFDEIVQYVRAWLDSEGITMQVISSIPFDEQVEIAFAHKVALAIITGCVKNEKVVATRQGYRVLREACKATFKKGEWQKIKGSRRRVTAAAVTILCRTFDEAVDLMTRILVGCGFGGRPMSEVTAVIVLSALGVGATE